MGHKWLTNLIHPNQVSRAEESKAKYERGKVEQQAAELREAERILRKPHDVA